MQAKKTQLWLNLSWNDERLQSLRLDTPQAVWLGEDGDLVLPQDVIGAPRLLLLTHADRRWLHPDGRAVALNASESRHFGDFVVDFVLTAREPLRLPAAWPRELAELGAALALAVALVAVPLWLGGQAERLHIQVLLPEDEVAAIAPVPAYVGDEPPPLAPAPPGPEPDRAPRTIVLPPTIIDLPRPQPTPTSVPVPVPPPAKPPEGPSKPRQSPTRVAQGDPRAPLDALDALGTPTKPQPRLFADPAPGDVERRNGTDVPHGATLAGDRPRPEPTDVTAAPRPHKLASNGDPDLRPDHQEVIEVHAPRVERIAGNGLDAETLRAYIQQRHGELRHCLELGMLGSVKLNGRVRVGFLIAPNGAVLQARVEESALHQPETEACIADRIRAWQFPPSPSGLPTHVRHGFVFNTK